MTQETAVPTPADVAALFKRPVIAKVTPVEEAKAYDVNDPHVVKAKHLTAGMEVRPFVHGQPRGSVRVVEDVTANEDGSEHYVEFSTPHPAQSYKAAYRFWDVNCDDTTETVTALLEVAEPVLVELPATKPVTKRVRPEPPEHLTHRPFAGLDALLQEVQN